MDRYIVTGPPELITRMMSRREFLDRCFRAETYTFHYTVSRHEERLRSGTADVDFSVIRERLSELKSHEFIIFNKKE